MQSFGRYILAQSVRVVATRAISSAAACATALMLLVGPVSAQAQTCENLFRENTEIATETATQVDPVKTLQTHLAAILREQADVRSREWTPEQLEEVRQKGRLEFETPERAVKYYRGLVAWKARLLETAISDIQDKRLYENLKATWPTKVSLEGRDILLFQYQPDFMRALEVSRTLLKTENPDAIQVAHVLLTIAELRSIRRNGWMDKSKIEARIIERMKDVFPLISSVKFEDLNRVAIAFRMEKMDCCGSGACDGCTHPNVVFRDRTRFRGPVYDGPAPTSTLPLYRVMDRLRVEFPEELFGWNFWDFAVPEANR